MHRFQRLARHAWWWIGFGAENDHPASGLATVGVGKFSLSVTPTGRLSNGVEAGERTIDYCKIYIDPGFNQLRRHQNARFLAIESPSHFGDDYRTMGGTHKR